MATTTTESETVYRTARNVLADYELHYTHAGNEAAHDEAPVALPTERQNPPDTQNPPDWPLGHRRVPPYRPVDHHLDPSQRYVFLNNGERIFVNVMFAGVRIVSTVNTIWRTTGGKLNDTVFRYNIGGEA